MKAKRYIFRSDKQTEAVVARAVKAVGETRGTESKVLNALILQGALSAGILTRNERITTENSLKNLLNILKKTYNHPTRENL